MRRLALQVVTAVALVLPAACGGAGGSGTGGGGGGTGGGAPSIAATTVRIDGMANAVGGGALTLTVDGAARPVAADGSWQADVVLPAGTATREIVVALSESGQEVARRALVVRRP